ncbi:MAG: diaminopimelate epimerase [Methanobacteriota archaeon]
MKFYKYHGAGNDFIIIDNLKGGVPERKKSKLASKLCDRKFGVGGDGLIFVENSKVADARMRIFNPDGSEAEMCGNGIRCFAKHVYEKGIVRKKEVSIETLAGIKKVKLTIESSKVTYVRVELGKPLLKTLNQKIKINDRELEVSILEVGVPHVVVFVEDVDAVDVQSTGRAVRHHRQFPNGTNVDFLQEAGKNVFKVRTYERGVEDETLACGTGVSACGAVAAILGRADASKPIEIRARGGTLFVELEKENGETKIYLNGPAKFVFEGEFYDNT